MKKGKYGLVFSLLLISYFSFSQNQILSSTNSQSGTQYIANVQHFSTKEGLSHWNTSRVFQDSKGFIWTGSKYGLNRFDGHNFQVFTKEKDGLPFNQVDQILEDSQGWLWLFKDENAFITEIAFINVQTLEIQSIEQRFGKNSPLAKASYYMAISSPSKSIYISTTDGQLIEYDISLSMKHLPDEKHMHFHFFSSDGTIFGNLERLGKDPQKTLVEVDTLGKILWTHRDENLTNLCEDKNGLRWFWNRIRQKDLLPLQLSYLTKEGQIEQLPPEQTPDSERLKVHPNGKMNYRKTDDTFWYFDFEQFWIFHPRKGLLYDFQDQYPQIIENRIHNIFFDNQSNAWVSTEHGIYKIQIKISPFKKYLSSPQLDYTVKTAISTRGLLVQHEKLWVNTTLTTRYQIDLSIDVVTELNPIIHLNTKGKNEPKAILSISKLNEQELLLGSRHGLFIQNIEDQSYRLLARKNQKKIPPIWTIFQDNHQNFWNGIGNRGLEFWDKETDSLEYYKNFNEFESLGKSIVYTFLEWDEEHILVGSTKGLFVLHQKKGIISRFWEEGKGLFHFPHNTIYHLHRDKENTNIVWVATGGGGLIRWTGMNTIKETDNLEPTSTSRQFTMQDGLSSNVLYAVYEDNNQSLWLPSDYGIIRFNKINFSNRAYIEEDGISHNEFNRISHCQDEKGNLYFGGLNGVTAFHPEKVSESQAFVKVPMRITNFQQYDGNSHKMVNRTSEIVQTHQIILNPGDKLFTLEFALLEYQDVDQIRYSYQLLGQDEDYIPLDNNQLRISGLPYGAFTLKIRGQSISDQSAATEIEIQISVLRPFYLKLWFLSLLAILVVVGSYSFYKWRTRLYKIRQKALEAEISKATHTIRSQNEELKKLDKVKSRFFANVSHELRTPLTLLLAPIQSTLKNNQLNNQDFTNLLIAKKNGEKLHGMINEILDLTKLESGKLELQLTTVLWYNFLRKIIANFESLANRKRIDLQFQYSGMQQLQVKLDQKKMEVILNNLLSNAFKFTPEGGEIRVSSKEEEGLLKIQITDSGRGIHPEDLPKVFNRFYQTAQDNIAAEGGTGIGLALSKEFAQLMKGKLTVKSELGKGSTFYLELPKTEIISRISDKDALELEALTKGNPETRELPTYDTSQIPGNGEPILLVEDNLDLQDFLQSLLAPTYRVSIANNGKEALDFLTVDSGRQTVDGSDSRNNQTSTNTNNHIDNSKPTTQNPQSTKKNRPPSTPEDSGRAIPPPGFGASYLPSLIISDVMMPIMDGYQLLEKLKNDDRYRHIPVIMLTAKGSSEDKLKALRIGVDDFMTKPFEEEELLTRIENLLRNSQLRGAFQEELNQEAKEKSHPKKAVKLNKDDLEWLENLERLIIEKIGDSHFSLEMIGHELGASRWQLNRRTKTLTGLTTQQYLQEIRLNHARDLLEKGALSSIKALSYEVGIKDVKYFSRQFRQRFGKLPSEYI